MPEYTKVVTGGSMGSFLDPPGSPQHAYEVVVRAGNHRPVGYLSLSAALGESWVEDATKARIRAIYSASSMQETDEWVAEVYKYFARCYSPDGVNRNVSNCIVDRSPIGPERDPNRHLGVMFVRSYFPDHEVRADLI